MEKQLQKKEEEEEEEKYSSSNQEEGFINPKLLRLGSPIPTPTPTDQESPIMKEASIDDERSNSTTLLDYENSQKAMCASKKRKGLLIDDPEAASSFKYSKESPINVETLLQEEEYSNQEASASSSIDDEMGVHDQKVVVVVGGDYQKNSSQASPSFLDISSFALSGSFSNPKPSSVAAAAAAAVIRNQTSSCPSSNAAAYLGRSSSFPSYFDSKSPENAAAIPNHHQKWKKNPSNSPSYFGKSRSLSSYFDDEDSPSSSSPCFHTASTLPTTTDVHKRGDDDDDDDDDEKPIIDDQDENGVLAANTEVNSVGFHSIYDLSCDLLNRLLSYLPAQEATVIPTLSKALLETYASNPVFIDSQLIRSWIPLWLEVDCERLSLSFSSIQPYREREKIMVFFIEALLKAHKALLRLHLRGEGAVSSYVLSQKFSFLKHLALFEVKIGSEKPRGIDIGMCLEELEMEQCQIPAYFELKVDSGGGSMKILIMEKCTTLGGEHIEISIKLPTLHTFKYHGHLSHFDLSKSRRLVELHLQFIGREIMLKDYWGNLNLVYDLLNSVKEHIQTLHLCDLCLQNVILTRQSQLTVAFPHLTELYLSISFKKEVLTNLACLLTRSVPLLRKLFITVTQSRFTPVWRSFESFDSATSNHRFEHLIHFGIKPFKGGLIETEILRLVLMNSPMLKKVDILLAYGVVCSLNEQEQQQMASIKVKRIKEEILKIPKASKEIEFVFLYEEGVKRV